MKARIFSKTPYRSGPGDRRAFVFTPAEWRHLLEDPQFLSEPDNSFSPRRLMGMPVRIVPSHRFG